MVEVSIYAIWIFVDVFHRGILSWRFHMWYEIDCISCDEFDLGFCVMSTRHCILACHVYFNVDIMYITMTVALYHLFPVIVDLGVDIICIVLQAPYSWGLLAFWRRACAHFLLFILYMYLYRLRVLHPQWYAGTRASELRCCLVGGYRAP